MRKIYVTKSFLPPIEEYMEKIKLIWENHTLTNYGPLNQEFVEKLKHYLEIENIHYMTNGTITLQVALEALNIPEGSDIITTPFTFIATASSIVWQKYHPVFADINETNFNINPKSVRKNITNKTKAILAVHCFGYPCDIEELEKISMEYNLPIIYDAAHTFGVKYNNRSLLSYGDISSCSLHATKVFHSVEGGLCIVNNDKYNDKINSMKNFGNSNGNYEYIGINAKNSEFHAAMGLCVLSHIDEIIEARKKVYEYYVKYLNDKIFIPKIPEKTQYNYIYFPILFESEEKLLKCFEELNKNGIYPRRYFYPCLNTLAVFGKTNKAPVALDISERIACLPMDTYLKESEIKKICTIINRNV